MLHGKDRGRSDGSIGSYIWSGKETQKVTMIMIQRRTKTNKIVKIEKRTKSKKQIIVENILKRKEDTQEARSQYNFCCQECL